MMWITLLSGGLIKKRPRLKFLLWLCCFVPFYGVAFQIDEFYRLFTINCILWLNFIYFLLTFGPTDEHFRHSLISPSLSISVSSVPVCI